MADKTLKTRIQQKRGTTAHWESSTLVPLEGEIILYTDLSPIGVKIGDGVHTASELEFIGLTSNGYPIVRKNGDIVTEDTIKNLAINPVSYIEPVQAGSGDPSPDNVRPINGWNTVQVKRIGKNFIARAGMRALPYTNGGVTFSDAGNGKISITGTTSETSGANLTLDYYSAGKRTYIPAGTYTLSGLVSGSGAKITLAVYESQEATSALLATDIHDTVKVRTFQIEKGGYFGCYFSISKNTTVDAIALPQLELGEVATAYEPYNSEIITAELPETVYGGSLDWATGELTVTHKITTIGALNVGHSVTSYQTFTLSGFPDALMVGDDVVTAVSDRFKGLTKNTISSTTDNYLWGSAATPTQMRLKCAIHEAMTAAEFKANFADTQIVYRLAEPYTIQLAPQQLKSIDGTNSVWSNCGSTEAVFNLALTGVRSINNKIGDVTLKATDLEDYYGPVHKSGNIISVNTIDNLAIHPITHIELIQAGTGNPSLDNVRSISGWNACTLVRTGKNLYPGAVMTNQNSSKDYVDYNFTTPIPPGTYTISLVAVTTDTDGTQCNAGFYTKVNGANESIGTCLFDRDTRSGATVTFDQPLMMMRLYAGRSSTTSAGDKATFTEIMIEAGTAMSNYEPYQAETLTVALPETIYGGYLDWTTGILTVEKGKHVLDGVNGIVDKVALNNGVYYASGALSVPGTKTGSNITSLMSDKLITKNKIEAGCCYITGSAENVLVIILPDQSLTDLNSVNAWLASNPITFVYDLANPYTIQLAPQQLKTIDGTNYVWSNSGDTEATFNLTPQMPSKSAFKSGTAEEWENDSYVPSAGELIIYTDTAPAGVKVGDGIHTASELNFINFINGHTQYFYCGSATEVIEDENTVNVLEYAETGVF